MSEQKESRDIAGVFRRFEQYAYDLNNEMYRDLDVALRELVECRRRCVALGRGRAAAFQDGAEWGAQNPKKTLSDAYVEAVKRGLDA